MFIFQLLEVCVFDRVDDLILEGLVHHPRIFVYSPSFVVLELYLVLVGRSGFFRTVGYTPGSGGLIHSVIERVV